MKPCEPSIPFSADSRFLRLVNVSSATVGTYLQSGAGAVDASSDGREEIGWMKMTKVGGIDGSSDEFAVTEVEQVRFQSISLRGSS